MAVTITTTTEHRLECDYLVVGAGAASLAFIDTLLTELPETKIVLIDKKKAPGGHWVDAYGFVRLHQPSRIYGIASLQLEGNWLRTMLTLCVRPWKHRATKQEILAYFGRFVEAKIASGQVGFYPRCIYGFETGEKDTSASNDEEIDNLHFFRSVDGSESYQVRVNIKLIDGTKGECTIPHDSPLQFPVDEEVQVMTPNQIYDSFEGENNKRTSLLLRNKYVVLGAGKTGIDCVVYLQRTMKIDPSDIAWVVSRDVWMGNSERGGDPQTWTRCLAECDNDTNKAALALEAKGNLVRLDSNVLPSRFRFPIIPPDELQLARNITTIIRRGRAKSIRRKSRGSAEEVVIEFGDGHPPWEAFAPIQQCVFVHATSPGPFNGSDPNIPVFNSPKTMTLQLILTGPRTFSMSLLAKLEAGRRNKTLDLNCLRNLVEENKEGSSSENDILNAAFRPLTQAAPYRSLMNLAIVLATLDRDPFAAIDWMTQNRLCFLSISGTKASSCEDIRMLRAKGKSLGLHEIDLSMLQVLWDKLRPLEGM